MGTKPSTRIVNVCVAFIPLVLIGLMAVFVAAPWIFRMRHRSPENTRRPLFTEWQDHDWGPNWGSIQPYSDASGVTVRADMTLNILLVFATGDGKDLETVTVGYESAVFRSRAASLEEIVIRNADHDMLVWIGLNGKQELHLGPGVATAINSALQRENMRTGRTRDLLGTVVRLYRGRDQSKLNKLATSYDEPAASPSSAPVDAESRTP